jgi:ribose 5-phosphate isomerase RpiB
MGVNGQVQARWGYAVERQAPPMLEVAIRTLHRDGVEPVALGGCNGEPCSWVCQVAECLRRGECQGAVLFCEDASLACCVANKVPGIRAAAVATINQAVRAVSSLGANLLVIEPAGRTFFEFKQILRVCYSVPVVCPPSVACVLRELDGHAHR